MPSRKYENTKAKSSRLKLSRLYFANRNCSRCTGELKTKVILLLCVLDFFWFRRNCSGDFIICNVRTWPMLLKTISSSGKTKTIVRYANLRNLIPLNSARIRAATVAWGMPMIDIEYLFGENCCYYLRHHVWLLAWRKISKSQFY